MTQFLPEFGICWIAVLVFAAVVAVIWGIAHVYVLRHSSAERNDVQELSHTVANEVTALRFGLRRMSNSSDPIAELVRALSARKEQRQ